MPLSRQQKEQLLDEYREGLVQAAHVFVLGYRGINVPRVTELREKVRGAGGQYLVVKNTIARKAMAGAALEALVEKFEGPTAVAYCRDEPVALAKVLTQFAKDVPVLEFKGGLVEGQPVAGADVQAIADLPGREELIAKLLYLMKSPVSRLVNALGAMPRKLVVALDQVRQKREA